MRNRTNVGHIGIRDGRIVQLRICLACGEEKIADPDSTISAFSPNTRHPDGTVKSYTPRCKPCNSARKLERIRALPPEELERRHARIRALYKEAMKDPERLRRRRELNRDVARRARANPEKAAKIAARARVYHARIRKENPQAVNEMNRMHYRLRLERQGKPLARKTKTVIDGTEPRVPAEPFTKWLRVYKAKTGLELPEISVRLRINERRLRAHFAGQQPSVALRVVDEALLHAEEEVDVDGVTIFGLEDLYPLEDVA